MSSSCNNEGKVQSTSEMIMLNGSIWSIKNPTQAADTTISDAFTSNNKIKLIIK